MKGRQHFIGPRVAGILGAALALALVFQQPGAVDAARDRVFDQFQRLSPRLSSETPVRVVEIDDAALARYGQWPWPRHQLAKIADNLTQAGAAAVVFDIILAEPDRSSPANVAQSWVTSSALDGVKAELGQADLTKVDHDRRLAAALAASPSVLPVTASASNASSAPCPPPLPASKIQGMTAGDLARLAPSFRQTVSPLPEFRAATKGEGFARAALKDDAVVRSVPLIALACDGKEIFPSLAVEALRVAAPTLDPQFGPKSFIDAAAGGACRTHVTGIAQQYVSELVLCRLRLPTTQDGQLWVHYSPRESIARRRLSLLRVLDGDPDLLAEEVRGRIVIIGATAEGLRDVLVTPLGDERAGAHIHAEVIEQALSGAIIYRAWDLMRPVEIIAALLVVLLLLIFLPRLSAASGFGVWALLMMLLFGGAYGAFVFGRILIDPTAPGIILASSFTGAFVVLFQQEQIAKQFIRSAFGKFLSPLILERIERDPSLLKLEGESREITAFFSDIRDFTTFSENLSPPQVTALLNQYFTPMTRIIVEHKGLVDKYMGDGLAAMWNAPVDVVDHPVLACRAALKMLSTLEDLNRGWRADENLPVNDVKIGIGLHTAEANVGNFGSEDHLEYSMLGDMVNLTSRLEVLTKTYRAAIIISAATWERLPGFAGVSLGAITVKGRRRATEVYALAGDEKLALNPAFQRFSRLFEEGVKNLEDGWQDAAMENFRACRAGETFGLGETVDYFLENVAGGARQS